MVSTVMKVSVVILAVSLVFAFSPVAEARDFGTIYKECGLGGMLFSGHPTAAVISNILWDWGTTAISSDVSSPESCAGGEASTAALIHDGYEFLEKDLARGSGDYLDTLMALSGCNTDVYQPLTLALREGFSASVAVEGYTNQTQFQKAEKLYTLFYSLVDGDFSTSCSNNNS